jgi:hypothetical protein
MKTTLLGAVSGFLIALVSGSVSAALVPKLGGQVVYDTDRNITWVADANLAASNTFGIAGVNADGTMDEGLTTANQWIAAMNAANYLGFNNWRLPTTLQPDPSCERQDEFGSRGLNCSGSEMGHLFYIELAATAGSSVLDTGDPAELAKFTNIKAKPKPGPDKYLSSTLFPSESAIYVFEFGAGVQDLAPVNDDHFVWAVRDGDVGPAVIEVTIDIKPGSIISPINPRSRGKVPVAILTTEDFDANTVDVSTVQVGPGPAQPVKYALEDIDGDTDWDLVLHFNTQETGIACGDTKATLTGQTRDGVPIIGTDSIKTVGCNKN